jgi:hypothetical protein
MGDNSSLLTAEPSPTVSEQRCRDLQGKPVNIHNADPESSPPALALREQLHTWVHQTAVQRQHLQGVRHDAPAPDDESDKVEESGKAEEIDRLRASFPQFRIWQENTYRGPRYIACRLQPGTRPHTLITSDLGELRSELGTGGSA